MIRSAAVALLVLASAAAAQTPRLAIRAAITDNASCDLTAMEGSILSEGRAVFLGEVLQTLGVGSLTDVHLEFDPVDNMPEIALTMSPDAAQAFGRLTEARVGQDIAIVLDGHVLTAPVVSSAIPGGRISITGQFTVAEAEAIAAAIREATQIVPTPVDLSTPEAAARSIRRAAAAGEWLVVARILHPTTLHALRETFDSSFVIAGDSVRASTARMYAPNDDGTPSQPDTLPLVNVRDVTGTAAPERIEDFSDEQAVALLYAGLLNVRPDYPDAPAVTAFTDAAGMAFVVLYPGPTTFSEDAGMAEAVIVQAMRVGVEWRVLLPRGAW